MHLNKLHKHIRSKTFEAINTFNMIEEGDKVVLGVSGGKDSMTLATILCELRDFSHLNFEIEGVFVDKSEITGDKLDFATHKEYFNKIGLKMHYFNINIPNYSKLKDGIGKSCQRCSYARRITLFKICEKFGYNKIALGHHLDDGIITLFINMLNNTNWALMPPINKMKKGDLKIIRPLSFVRESNIKKFVSNYNIPFYSFKCAIGESGRRKQVAGIIDSIEAKGEKIENIYFASIKKFIKEYKDKDYVTD